MVTVIGVRFRTAGKIYYFDPTGYEVKAKDHVIVETARGVEYGLVVLPPHEVEDSEITPPLKKIIRMANDEDASTNFRNKEKSKEAFRICLEKIRYRELPMKLVDCEYTFDTNKLLFYFTADNRVDFRELVKDLAFVFHTRIELRQIGVRDETKVKGGIGICGRPVCCASFLSDFSPVSIKMAKEQGLPLNPTKISGLCGRLMCCLANEELAYEDLNRTLPNVGDFVTTPEDLKGVVVGVNVLRQRVTVDVSDPESDDKDRRDYPVSELKFNKRGRHRSNSDENVSAEEKEAAKQLEALEKKKVNGLDD